MRTVKNTKMAASVRYWMRLVPLSFSFFWLTLSKILRFLRCKMDEVRKVCLQSVKPACSVEKSQKYISLSLPYFLFFLFHLTGLFLTINVPLILKLRQIIFLGKLFQGIFWGVKKVDAPSKYPDKWLWTISGVKKFWAPPKYSLKQPIK